jgi:hypothetical protein
MFINGSVGQYYKKKSHLFSEYEEPQFSENMARKGKGKTIMQITNCKIE